MDTSKCAITSLWVLLAGCTIATLGCEQGEAGLPYFKNEFSVLDFIDVNTYKEIDCAAENACDIEWYKDGVRFPFGFSENQLQDMGVTKGSYNQTLIFKKAEMKAMGNYTCVVSNQHGDIRRHLELRVLGNDWIHEPILAFDNHCNDKETRIGQNASFTCKFFVGPKDDETIANWYYLEKDTGENSDKDNHMIWVFDKEENYTVYNTSMTPFGGKYVQFSLDIFNVTEPALGTYVIVAFNGVGTSRHHRVRLSLRHADEKRRHGKLRHFLHSGRQQQPR